MISPKICHCIHPFFRKYAPVSTPSSYCIRYSVIKRYSVIVLYKMHIVHWLKSFVASLDDSGHNVEWLGGAASHNLRKVEAMQPL